MVYYSSSNVSIGFEATRSLIWGEWIGEVPSQEFRHASNMAMQLAEQNNPKFWLSNNKLATLLHPADQAWVNEVFIPRMVKTGIQKMAIIIPDEFYNQMILEDIIDKSSGIINFEIQFFADEYSAREWFRETVSTEDVTPIAGQSSLRKPVNPKL